MKNEQKNVRISSELYKKVEKKIAESGFNTVDEYVAFVLEQVLEETDEARKSEQNLSQEDEAEVKKRLKSLGYFE